MRTLEDCRDEPHMVITSSIFFVGFFALWKWWLTRTKGMRWRYFESMEWWKWWYRFSRLAHRLLVLFLKLINQEFKTIFYKILSKRPIRLIVHFPWFAWFPKTVVIHHAFHFLFFNDFIRNAMCFFVIIRLFTGGLLLWRCDNNLFFVILRVLPKLCF